MPVASESMRRAVPADLPALGRMLATSLHASWNADAIAAEFKIEWSIVEVLVHDAEQEEIRGLLVYWHVADELQLLYVATDPHHLRKGIGRKLMQHLCLRAKRLHATCITLEVRADNDAALQLYRGIGFVEVGRRRGYYQTEGIDAVLMEWRTT